MLQALIYFFVIALFFTAWAVLAVMSWELAAFVLAACVAMVFIPKRFSGR